MRRFKKLHIFCDGGARGNPGPAAIGVVIQDETGITHARFGKVIGRATNNSAEYQAVIAALAFLQKNKWVGESIELYLDSTVVAQQLNGVFKIKDTELKELFLKVRALEHELQTTIVYRIVPRTANRLADALVNQVLDEESVA